MVTGLLPQKNPAVDIIAGQYKLSVEGKKMDSNPNERGVHIKSSKDYLLDVNGNLSQSTISGIVSIKLGLYTKHEVCNCNDYQPRDNTNANRWYAWTSTTGTTWNHTSTGNVQIVGARIDFNP